MMTEIENLDKLKLLWVIKLCLKIIYPRYNLYTFLVYIAIKNRLWNIRITKRLHFNMSNINLTGLYSVKTIPDRLHKELVAKTLCNKFVCDKTNLLIISYENFASLSSENLFYKDGHTIWMHLNVPFSTKKKKDELSEHVKDVKRFLKMEKHRQSNDGFKLLHKTKLTMQSRMVQIMPSYLVSHNELYVTETELFNLKNIFQLPYNVEDFEAKLSPVPNLTIPQIAIKATLDLVLNPYDLPDEYISLLLNNYFELPRCIHRDDVIGISINNKSTDILDYKYLDFIENCNKIYFKCTKLEAEIDTNKANDVDLFADNESDCGLPFYIIKGKTELKTGLTVHSKLPKSRHISVVKMKFDLNTKYLDNYIWDACPLGLQKLFNNLQASILPFVIEEKYSPINLLTSPLLPIFMLSGPSGSGKHLVLKLLARHNGLNYLLVDSNNVMCSTAKQTESRIQAFVQRAKACAPVIVVLDHFENFGSDAESNEDRRIIDFFTTSIENLYKTYIKHPIIFIALSTTPEMKPNISRIFLEKYQINKPNKTQRYDNLKWLFSVMNLQLCDSHFQIYSDEDENDGNLLKKKFLNVLETLACKTETFSFSNIDNLIHLSLKNSFGEQKLLLRDSEIFAEPNLFMVREEDLIGALEQMRTLQSQGLDTPKIPKVYWEDIGGLEKLKKELMKTIEFPVKYPHLLKNSALKRTGILLYGPPGCGKTLVAKAVSTELNISFMSVKGPELLNMYIGQSEENVRKVFQSARASSPCLVFLDEVDALAPRRGAAGDSGGAADRLLSQLLAEIDGVVTGSDDDQSSSLVFIMGATNRPDLLEQSLLRPGRLDKLIYIGPYQGNVEKEKVLTALCRRHKMSDDVNLMALCSTLPERCTGADLLQVISGARAAAIRKLIARVEQGEVSESELSPDLLVIYQEDMETAVDSFKPSITDEELAYYETLSNKL